MTARWHVLDRTPDTARDEKEELDSAIASRERSALALAKTRLFTSLRRSFSNERVIDAMEAVPRELFVPPDAFHLAYADGALPIGDGQTISQPYIVAMMTEALDLKGDEKVLEVDTGSGYQAAALSRRARKVVSVERKASLLTSARGRLATLDIMNVELNLAGDAIGWPEGAPYQGIIITAAAPRIPQGLLDQLDEGGRLVIPTDDRLTQNLLKVIKRSDGVSVKNLGGCAFVPLIGTEAWAEED